MADMQTLEEVIEQAEFDWNHSDPTNRSGKAATIATAVRAFLGSEEVVERACAAGAAFSGKEWPIDFNGHEQEAARACTRIEMSSAIGGK